MEVEMQKLVLIAICVRVHLHHHIPHDKFKASPGLERNMCKLKATSPQNVLRRANLKIKSMGSCY